MSEIAKLFVSIGANTKEFERGMKNVQSQMKNAGRSMTQAGKGLSMYVTAPLVGIGTAVAKVGMDYEKQMARVQAISGATGEELQKLEDVAREMGRSTSFSATKAAEGLEFLAMAGWEVEDAVEGLPAILRMAEAMQMELGDASDIVSNMMTAFGMEATEAGRATDVLAATAMSANTDVQMLGDTMRYLAPAASNAGWSLEDAAAMAGKLADAGMQGSMAGTTLNAMIADLTNTTDSGAKALEELGVDIYDAEGNMRSAVDIIASFERGMEGMTQQQKDTALANIFGQRALRGVNLLLAEGSESLGEYTDSLYNAEGAVDEAGEVMRDTLWYQLEELKSMLQDVALELNDVLGPVIRDVVVPAVKSFVEWLQTMAEWFANLDPRMQSMILAGLAIAAALGPVLIVVGQLVIAISAIIPIIGKVIGAGGLLLKILPVIKVAFAALTGPIGIVIAIVAALAYGVYMLIKHWDVVKDFFAGLWETVKEFFAAAWEWIKGLFLEYHPAGILFAHWDQVAEWFGTLVEGVKQFFGEAWEWLKSLFLRYHPAGILFTHWSGVVSFFGGVIDGIRRVFSRVFEYITGPFKRARDALGGIASGIGNALKTISPWHRSSPSLVEQVQSGVGEIMEAYKNLDRIELGPIAHQLEGSVLSHTGEITIRGVNNEGEFIASSRVVMNDLARQMKDGNRRFAARTSISPLK